MAMKYLGESYDIHASSRELVFPHHENKIAIAGALTGKPLARYWVHCDRVLVGGKKIDEQGEGPTLSDLTGMGYSGREIRYWLLSVHYRKPVVFSKERLEDAKRSLKRIDACIYALAHAKSDAPPYPEMDQLLYDLKHGFISAMDDDLNIAEALAAVFNLVREVNTLSEKGKLGKKGAREVKKLMTDFDKVLGILEREKKDISKEVEKLIQEREDARKTKDWMKSDHIRDRLKKMGVILEDSQDGVKWKMRN